MLKNPSANAGDAVLIPGLGRSPGVGNGNPLQSSCLENPTPAEPGRLQSVASQRVGCDGVTKHKHIIHSEEMING